MKFIQILLVIVCLALGFVIGRGTVSAPRERVVVREIRQTAALGADKTSPVAKPEIEDKPVAVQAAAKPLTDWTVLMNRGERLVGLLGALAACPQGKLSGFYAEMRDLLMSGKLAAEDFDILVETMGGRGDATLAAILMKDRLLTGARAKGLEKFMTNWAAKSPEVAWRYLKALPKAEVGERFTRLSLAVAAGIRNVRSPLFAEIVGSEVGLKKAATRMRLDQHLREQGFELALKELSGERSGGPEDELFQLETIDMSYKAMDGGSENMASYLALLRSDPKNAFNLPGAWSTFARLDHKASLDLSLKLPSGDERTTALSASVRQVAETNPDAAIKLVAELPSGTDTEQLYVIKGLENGFKASPHLSKNELADLLDQTQKLQSQLRTRDRR